MPPLPNDLTTSRGGLNRRQYIGHFLIVFTGNGAAQAVNLVGYPFLARLYSPEQFGLFGMFVAAAAVPGTVACARFEFAIPTAPRWGVNGVLWLSFLLSAVLGLISAAAAAIYFWATLPALPQSVPPLFGLCVALTGVCTASSFFLMRHEYYRAAAASLFVRTGTVVVTQIALAFISATAISLIMGFTLGLLAQAGVLGVLTWRRIHPGPPRCRSMSVMFRRFRKQVFVDFPSTLIAALAGNILTFGLAVRYDQRMVGFYSMGSRLAVVPLTLFNDSLSQVFFQKAARAREEKGHMWDELKFSLLISGLLSAGVLVAIVLLARPFIGIFLGQTWLPAADMLIVLAPMLAVRSLSMSVATTVFVLRSAHWLLIHNVATLVLPLLAIAASSLLNLDPIRFLMIVSGLLTVEYACFGLFLAVAARREHQSVQC